jgi:hypothetical protein
MLVYSISMSPLFSIGAFFSLPVDASLVRVKGFSRILTSGGKANALEGKDIIR